MINKFFDWLFGGRKILYFLIVCFCLLAIFVFGTIFFGWKIIFLNLLISFVWLINLLSAFSGWYNIRNEKYNSFDVVFHKLNILLLFFMWVGSIVLIFISPEFAIFVFILWIILMIIHAYLWSLFIDLIPSRIKYELLSEYLDKFCALDKSKKKKHIKRKK